MKNDHGTNPAIVTNITVTKSEIKQFGIFIGYIMSILSSIISHYFFSLSRDEKNKLLQNKDAFAKKIYNALVFVFAVNQGEFVETKVYWQGIYKKHFDMHVDFTNVSVPSKPNGGKWRLLFIAQGLMIEDACSVYRRVMKIHNSKMQRDGYYSASIDYRVNDNIRNPKDDSYAIWVRDGQESDEEFYGQSAKQADPNKLIGITLLERMIYGIVYFIETKKHLDEKGLTICSGSRTVDGLVPRMRWYPDNHSVFVGNSSMDDYYPIGGIRQVIS
ncbi:MAG: hypothetical protein WC099_00885 [Candidatus Paceibacterota bacterium]